MRLAVFPHLLFLFFGAALFAAPGEKIRYDQGDPTDLEQYAMELVNRARRAPISEALLSGVDANELFGPSGEPPHPLPPLAFHPALLEAARSHSDWMLENDVFSHVGDGGSHAGKRMLDAGYPFAEPFLWGENIGWEGVTGNIAAAELVRRIHRNIFRSPGHRWNMLQNEHDEVGIGIASGEVTFGAVSYHSLMLTENFSASAGSPTPDGPYLTGVVYADANDNNFYDPGEGISGVTISILESKFFAVSSASGGYAIPLGSLSGDANLEISSENGESDVLAISLAAGQNTKIDVVENFEAGDPHPMLSFDILSPDHP